MPALPADIAAASRDAVTVTWADAAIAARYPNARDGSLNRAEGFCDNAADAQVLANQRGALIGTERRRFAVGLQEILWPNLGTGVPTSTLIDAEQAVNAASLEARIEIDLEAEASNLEMFG